MKREEDYQNQSVDHLGNQRTTRRDFLKKSAKVGAVAGIAASILPILSSCKKKPEEAGVPATEKKKFLNSRLNSLKMKWRY